MSKCSSAYIHTQRQNVFITIVEHLHEQTYSSNKNVFNQEKHGNTAVLLEVSLFEILSVFVKKSVIKLPLPTIHIHIHEVRPYVKTHKFVCKYEEKDKTRKKKERRIETFLKTPTDAAPASSPAASPAPCRHLSYQSCFRVIRIIRVIRVISFLSILFYAVRERMCRMHCVFVCVCVFVCLCRLIEGLKQLKMLTA